MFKVALVFFISFSAHSAFADRDGLHFDRANSARSRSDCPCSELERRQSGFNMALAYADQSASETEDLYCALDEAGGALVEGLRHRKGSSRRLEACREGLREVERTWSKWKSWVQRNKLDLPLSCYHEDESIPEYGWDAGLPHPLRGRR